ncbi:Serine carboxypeptidase 46 [Hibiscus syriacus]|uniref:Serine carboxypeptidase 46 n=1 Tax=Hibiscus syriacus TaxID=106335 RepID=A0A6A3BBX6_HIBSY|nr:Serine carboxypeptidase 46 [Hibiscus syriacus]
MSLSSPPSQSPHDESPCRSRPFIFNLFRWIRRRRKPGDDLGHYLSEFKRRGKEALFDFIISNENKGKPITCIIYSLLVSWAAEVARKHHIPSAVLWTQAATVFDIYYFYFNGYESAIKDQADESESKRLIKLPGLQPLATRDLPSFVTASNVHHWGLSLYQEQMEVIAEEPNAKILVNTFDAMEPEALRAIEKFKMITIDSKQKSSVVYVSFGSVAELAKQQVEEIARALIASGRPFLWVSHGVHKWKCCLIRLWVASCRIAGGTRRWRAWFGGVPVVAFPLWTDQATNAMLIEDVWQTGVRVSANEEGIVERSEIVRCLDLTMGDGEEVEEVKKNVEKWKELAREAAMDGGSLDMNLKTFVDDVAQGCK